MLVCGAAQALMHRGASEQDLCDVFALLNQLMVRITAGCLRAYFRQGFSVACETDAAGVQDSFRTTRGVIRAGFSSLDLPYVGGLRCTKQCCAWYLRRSWEVLHVSIDCLKRLPSHSKLFMPPDAGH